MNVVTPAFKYNNFPIVMETSLSYFPHLCVALQSIVENSNPCNNYDILILSNEIGDKELAELKDFYRLDNFSIRCIDPSPVVAPFIETAKYDYLNLNYFRLALPWILSMYAKVVNLGSDILVRRDIAEIFSAVDSKEFCFAGVTDYGYLGKLRREISQNELDLRCPNFYINADVLVINLERIRNTRRIEDVLEIWQTRYLRHAEQDAISMAFQNEICLIDDRWNVFAPGMETEETICRAGTEIARSWERNIEDAFILHYAGEPKPWKREKTPKEKVWWETAIRSPQFMQIESGNTRRRGCLSTLIPKRSAIRAIIKRCVPFGSRLWIALKKFDKM